MTSASSMVFVVDDDQSVREALSSLIRSIGLDVETYASAHEYLRRPPQQLPACLVLDVRMPGLSGLDLQRELAQQGREIPIIFVTAHGDIPMTVKAMKAGAAEFLSKPFRDQDLLDAICQALARDRASMAARADLAEFRWRYATLTQREKDVATLVVRGLPNKQVAAKLHVSEITVKVHRRHIMLKMEAKSLPELVRITETLRLHSSPESHT
ncbi:MAG TPA: response regulator transcription factor [Steroidobacteraceae bacterium]|nr:response regulator transcription factor [Steroidobacteraceae bacterium]